MRDLASPFLDLERRLAVAWGSRRALPARRPIRGLTFHPTKSPGPAVGAFSFAGQRSFKTNKPAQITPRFEQRLDPGIVGGRIMTYDSDLLVELEIERLRHRNRPRAERACSNQGMSAAIRMRIGDWYVDEHGILTREIKARD
jgi:hypothetical protein